MGWGRNAVEALPAGAARPVRHGLYSILLGFFAPLLVAVAAVYLFNLPKEAGGSAEDFAAMVLLVLFGFVAPLIHATGIGFGIAGLRNPAASKLASVIGILLNLALIVIGFLLGLGATSTIGAFT